MLVTPKDGMRLFDKTAGQVLLYSGGWQRPAAPALPSEGDVVDAEGRSVLADLITALVAAGVLSSG